MRVRPTSVYHVTYVVFGRSAILPQDILFNHHEHAHPNDVTTASEYSEDTSFALQDIYDQVLQNLQLSKVSMQRQYSNNFRIINNQTKQQKIVHHEKLSPARDSERLQGENEPPLDKQGQLNPNHGRNGCSSSDFSSDSATLSMKTTLVRIKWRLHPRLGGILVAFDPRDNFPVKFRGTRWTISLQTLFIGRGKCRYKHRSVFVPPSSASFQ